MVGAHPPPCYLRRAVLCTLWPNPAAVSVIYLFTFCDGAEFVVGPRVTGAICGRSNQFFKHARLLCTPRHGRGNRRQGHKRYCCR